jgi:hypothetical protein
MDMTRTVEVVNAEVELVISEAAAAMAIQNTAFCSPSFPKWYTNSIYHRRLLTFLTPLITRR